MGGNLVLNPQGVTCGYREQGFHLTGEEGRIVLEPNVSDCGLGTETKGAPTSTSQHGSSFMKIL